MAPRLWTHSRACFVFGGLSANRKLPVSGWLVILPESRQRVEFDSRLADCSEGLLSCRSPVEQHSQREALPSNITKHINVSIAANVIESP
jgi:hypothetical protein